MSGLDDLLAESEDRWAKAERRAQGVADKGLGKAVRTYFTLYFPVGVVLLFIIGAVLGMLLFQGLWATARSYVFAGTMLAGIGTIAAGITYNSKVIGSSVAMGSMNVTMSLDTAEQKEVRREILGRATLRPEHLAVKRAAAVQLRKALSTQLVVVAPILEFQFLTQVLNDKNPIAWLSAIIWIAYTVFLVVPVRQFLALGRFLDQTAETS
jgi:hypothetical protein